MIDEIQDILCKAVYEGGVLLKVEYLFDDYLEFPVSIIFSLEHLLLVIKAVSDDDTVEITNQMPRIDNACKIVDVSSKKPWDKLIQHKLQWVWGLTNQQGYFDGFQLDFNRGNNESNDPNIIQLLVIASSLKTYYLYEEKISD
jgi:hypothetical protein